ncbi:MAG: aminotransferase class V-fold PLP-dependent enzyme [Cytophagaceae bacterium]
MLNFYPGPSKLHASIEEDMQQALRSGILSMNHRSKAFSHLYQTTEIVAQEVFHLPSGYKVYFTSSATECWEIIAQSFPNYTFTHIYNGAFGNKWKQVSEALGRKVQANSYSFEEPIPASFYSSSQENSILCLTQVETSNGSCIPSSKFGSIRTNWKGLIAVDATTSMAGVETDFSMADIWFASVQKCFGLPSGLAVLVVSPRVEETLKDVTSAHYNDLKNIIANGQQFQTTHTPNILGIYLLKQRLAGLSMELPYARVVAQMNDINRFFEKSTFSPIISEKEYQSPTVLTLKASSEAELKDLFQRAEAAKIILGKGYGEWKSNTFRIANFPAHTKEDIGQLISFFSAF